MVSIKREEYEMLVAKAKKYDTYSAPQKKYREKRKEYYKEYHKKWQQEHKEWLSQYQKERRAKKKQVDIINNGGKLDVQGEQL